MSVSISQMEEREQETREQNQTLLSEEERLTKSAQTRRNPPARNTSRFWFERFLAIIQRQNPSTIDATFLSQIAPSNEGKLLAQLKFLHVIDDQGKPTQLLSMLNMVGDEQKKAFQEIARESYQDLFAELKLEKAVPDDLINFFIRKYAFTRDKAINAAKFFLYLAEKGSISVSAELGGFLSEKVTSGSNGTNGQQLSTPRIADKVATRSPLIREMRPAAAQVRQQILLQKKKAARNLIGEEFPPSIQATINITLDKDTPKEYWDRVLALLGERKDSPDLRDVAMDGETQAPEENHNEQNANELTT